jgi:3-dehydroquinate synthase
MQRIEVDLQERSYEILIESGLLDEPGPAANEVFEGRSVLLVGDSNTAAHYQERGKAAILKAGALRCETFVFPAGEEQKNFKTLEILLRHAAELELDRKCCFVALGGGVCGDLTGFAAASYMRGVDFVQIPTSLLAMVDSSVGGKTGIDLPEGKNLVGAFWQPQLVLIDPELLQTLPARELRSGLAEVAKYAVIMDAEFFEILDGAADKLLSLDLGFYEEIIARCCQLKADVVAEDERESGLRAILNYGHTFGHALEIVTDFTLSHGEGVAIGMNMAANMAVKMGIFSSEAAAKQQKLLNALELPQQYSGADPDEVFRAMFKDKKQSGGKLTVILPEELGKVRIERGAADGLVRQAVGSCL